MASVPSTWGDLDSLIRSAVDFIPPSSTVIVSRGLIILPEDSSPSFGDVRLEAHDKAV